MMAATNHHGGTLAGTAGGTLLSIFASIQAADVANTVLFASIGAITSFLISMAMKWITRKWLG